MIDLFYKHPRGVIENALVKVDKFLFLTDFVILDMEEDDKVPIILGRPFLTASKVVSAMDCSRVEDEEQWMSSPE